VRVESETGVRFPLVHEFVLPVGGVLGSRGGD
jgi:hypothetical protein